MRGTRYRIVSKYRKHKNTRLQRLGAPVSASRYARLLRRGRRLRLTRTLANAHTNAWGLRPFARTLAVAHVNVRPFGLTRKRPYRGFEFRFIG